ncbi:MAG: hypothetical protein JWN38_1153 [Candidatus Saccharibacteria bacterium]|nr:hypothetical protein [Candidatus Saccharibacteria bacterium]
MSETISIADLDKAAVLAALFNGSRPQGLGFLAYNGGEGMTTEQAQAILDSGQTGFDYLQGRVMKVDLSGDSFDPWGYDRDNGQNAAKVVIDELRSSGVVNGNMTQGIHEHGRERAAIIASEHLGGESHFTSPGVVEMGFDELSGAVGERIRPYLNK